MREKERKREREREREVLIGKTYIQQIRDESLQNTCVVFEYYLCDETKQKKKSSLFIKRGAISAPLFFYSFSLA
tara:strand:+ start:8611 stop:8832 length:222 start_codon:yes stop_codon:yes gene_type:complete